MKNIISFFKWLIILLLITSGAVSVYVAVKLGQPATTESFPRDFEIRKGEHAGEIMNRLAADKIVRSEMLMEIYLRWKNAEEKLQAGVYILDSNMTIPEIVQVLSGGKVKANAVRFTVVEGARLGEVAEVLEKQGIVSYKDFLNVSPVDFTETFDPEFDFLYAAGSLEGYLFPDTYLIAKNATPQEVARKMLANFDKKVTPELRTQIKNQGRSLKEVVILASIVEKEVGRNFKKGTKLSEQDLQKLSEERRIVAGVFMNRLNARMGLESDATLQYITGSKSPRATIEETKLDSPYNTYKYRGLPPTPISNPSLDSILAAIHPADTDFLYFLTEADGTAHFAKTFEEHKQNRVRYLE